MCNNTWKVYKYTDKHNGLIYIGITSRTLKERWQSGYGYKGNPRLHHAIQKYGENNFVKEILIEGLTQEEAFQKEIELIEKYHARNPKIGYNLSIGGSAPMFGRHHSEETKQLFSKTRKGKNNSFYGKHHDRTNCPTNIPVICLNTLEIFPSLTIAGEEKSKQGCTGCHERNISHIFETNSRQWTAGKDMEGTPLFWEKYDKSKSLEDYQQLFEDRKKQHANYLQSLKFNPVMNLIDGKIFDNPSKASEYYDIPYNLVAGSCRGNKKTTYGQIFIYINDYEELTNETITEIIVQRWTNVNPPIVCLNTGKIYKTQVEARDYANIKFSDSIRNCAEHKSEYAGFAEGQYLKWMFYDEYSRLELEEIQAIINKPVKGSTPVYCVETNTHYLDASSASFETGILAQNIQKCCTGKYKHCGGFTWQYDTAYNYDLYPKYKEHPKRV